MDPGQRDMRGDERVATVHVLSLQPRGLWAAYRTPEIRRRSNSSEFPSAQAPCIRRPTPVNWLIHQYLIAVRWISTWVTAAKRSSASCSLDDATWLDAEPERGWGSVDRRGFRCLFARSHRNSSGVRGQPAGADTTRPPSFTTVRTRGFTVQPDAADRELYASRSAVLLVPPAVPDDYGAATSAVKASRYADQLCHNRHDVDAAALVRHRLVRLVEGLRLTDMRRKWRPRLVNGSSCSDPGSHASRGGCGPRSPIARRTNRGGTSPRSPTRRSRPAA